jgi:hypothetical protein
MSAGSYANGNSFMEMKKIVKSALIAGIIVFVVSYGGLYLSIQFMPFLFVKYINPMFTSDSGRDILFYSHAFVLSLALSWFWDRFKVLFKGHYLVRGLEFGLVYGVVALAPVMWITFSSLDVTLIMVISWFIYGLSQAVVAGVVFAKLNP